MANEPVRKRGPRPPERGNTKSPILHKHDPSMLALREAKRRLLQCVAGEGLTHICRIIKRGPGSDDSEAQHRLWQFAMTFAADRSLLIRTQGVDFTGDEMPAIEVRLGGFARPSDT